MARAIWVSAIVALSTIAAAAMDGVTTKRGYVDSRFGQTHYYTYAPATGPGPKTPIAFFHQNPRSAVDFEPLTSELGKDRLVMAFDTPGYGMSDRPGAPPSMAELSASMAESLTALGYGKKRQVDVFGFHTGAFIAAELAVAQRDMVRRLVLSGIAYYDPEFRKKRAAALNRDEAIPEDAGAIVRQWYTVVNARTPGIPIARAARVYIDQIRALNKGWYGSNAVLGFDPNDRLPKINQPVLIVQPHEMLLNETRAAQRELLPKATMVEIPEATKDVFDLVPQDYARHMRAFLDQ